MAKLSYIIPCFFSEHNLPPLIEELKLTQKLFPDGTSFEYIFVDDGSPDGTWAVLEKLQKANSSQIKIMQLVKNVGSHLAIFAGMKRATGDCHVILAADLQDPPELVPQLFSHWQNGFSLAIAHRSGRDESFVRSTVANTFHWLFKRFAISNLPDGGFDLLLFDKKLTKMVLESSESGVHVPYSLFNLGFPFAAIPYVRKKREIGKSSWTVAKKVRLLIDAFVGYSYAPIRMITALGFIFAVICLVYMVTVLISFFTHGSKVEGWSSLIMVVLAASAFQFISLGILGEYLWRVLDTVRQRPRYTESKFISTDSDSKIL